MDWSFSRLGCTSPPLITCLDQIKCVVLAKTALLLLHCEASLLKSIARKMLLLTVAEHNDIINVSLCKLVTSM